MLDVHGNLESYEDQMVSDVRLAINDNFLVAAVYCTVDKTLRTATQICQVLIWNRETKLDFCLSSLKITTTCSKFFYNTDSLCARPTLLDRSLWTPTLFTESAVGVKINYSQWNLNSETLYDVIKFDYTRGGKTKYWIEFFLHAETGSQIVADREDNLICRLEAGKKKPVWTVVKSKSFPVLVDSKPDRCLVMWSCKSLRSFETFRVADGQLLNRFRLGVEPLTYFKRFATCADRVAFSFIRIDKEKIRSFVNVFDQASGKKIYDCKFNVEKLLAIEEQRLILGAPFGNSMVVATFANVP